MANHPDSQTIATRPKPLLPWMLLALAAPSLMLLDCRGGREDTIEPVAQSPLSPRVTQNLDKINGALAAIKSDDPPPLDQAAELYNQINEGCDDLQGKNQVPAPSPQDWGNLDAQTYKALLLQLRGLENNAELCRDYARGGHVGKLEVQRIVLLEKADALAHLLAQQGKK